MNYKGLKLPYVEYHNIDKCNPFIQYSSSNYLRTKLLDTTEKNVTKNNIINKTNYPIIVYIKL